MSVYEHRFDFSQYGEAIERRERALRAANEAQEELEEANRCVALCEARLRKALDESMTEARLYAQERAGA